MDDLLDKLKEMINQKEWVITRTEHFGSQVVLKHKTLERLSIVIHTNGGILPSEVSGGYVECDDKQLHLTMGQAQDLYKPIFENRTNHIQETQKAARVEFVQTFNQKVYKEDKEQPWLSFEKNKCRPYNKAICLVKRKGIEEPIMAKYLTAYAFSPDWWLSGSDPYKAEEGDMWKQLT